MSILSLFSRPGREWPGFWGNWEYLSVEEHGNRTSIVDFLGSRGCSLEDD